MRAAVYWAPALDDPLWQAGCAWLGRDAATGAVSAQPAVPGIAALTAEARRYGFHATLRPPMKLATGWDAFRAAVREVARNTAPVTLPRFELAAVGGFLVLRESAPCPALQALCDSCVVATNPHRLPPSRAELARRRAAGLSARQEEMLARFGYPYVMDQWFFHMTLTRRLAAADMASVMKPAVAHFGRCLDVARVAREICIFTQLGEGDFLIAERFGLRG